MKRKSLRRISALLLAATMVGGLLTGCGNSEENKKESTEATKATSESTSKPAAESSSEEVKEELEYVKLKFISVGDPNAETTPVFLEKVNAMLMEDLNCEIEVQHLTFAEQGTKYPLVVSSGEDYDVIFTANWTSYGTHALNGAYMELTDEMLQEYSPMYYEMCKDYLHETKVDGKNYMYMQSGKDCQCPCGIVVRGDIMKAAGLTEVSTGEQMLQYLDYVKANHPEMDLLPVTQGSTAQPGILANAILADQLKYASNSSNDYANGNHTGVSGIYAIDTTDPSNLKFVDEAEIDRENLLKYNTIKELRLKGYWDEDCLSKTGGVTDHFLAGTGAFVLGGTTYSYDLATQLNATHPEYEAQIFQWSKDPHWNPTGTGSGAAINANSKNWERAMMVCDLFECDPEYIMLLQYGVEGVHYTMNDNGSVHLIENPEYIWSEPTFRSFLTSAKPVSDVYDDNYNEIMDTYGRDNAVTPLLCSMTFDKTNVANEIAAMSAINKEYSPILNTGLAEDVEAFYAEYKEALYGAGMQKVLDELLKQAQAFYDNMQ